MGLYVGKTHTIDVGSRVLEIFPNNGPRHGAQSVRIEGSKLVEVKIYPELLVIRYRDFSIREIQVKFPYTYQADDARRAIKRIMPKGEEESGGKRKQKTQTDPLTKAAVGVFGAFYVIGKQVAKEAKREREQAHKEEPWWTRETRESAAPDPFDSGTITTTTYVNGAERKVPTEKEDIKAVFLAEYVKSPRTVEQPWANTWEEQYRIQDVQAYLESLVREGYLEEAVLGKALSALTNDQIRDILSQLSLKTSGAKSVLIARLLDEADKNEVRRLLPAAIYALTDRGIEFLRSKRNVLESQWIDCEKVIRSGMNVSPEPKEPSAKPAKKKVPRKRSKKTND